MDKTTQQLLDRLAWAEVEVEDNPTPANIISTFQELGDRDPLGWEVDFYNSDNDDNCFIRFHHPDHDNIYIHIIVNDDPYYIPLFFDPANGLYDHQLPDNQARLDHLNRDKSLD